MASHLAPVASRPDAEPVDRLSPRPIPRARPAADAPAPGPSDLSIRFAEEGPEIEPPDGEITLVEGTRGTETARHRLVLDAARAGRTLVHIVGEQHLDTTRLARRAQAQGLDPGYVLRSSIVARAFTAYQLSVLLEERLPSALAAEDAAAGLVLDPLRLYTDEDVQAAEARRLAEQAVDRLQDVADGFDVPLVVMQPPRAQRRELTRMLREAANAHVLVRAEDGSQAAQSGRARPAYTVHVSGEGTYRIQDPRPTQARLDRFGGGTDG